LSEAINLLNLNDFDVAIAVGNPHTKKSILKRFKTLSTPALVHPNAIVSPSANLQDGVHVLAGAIIQAHTTLQAHVLVGPGVIIEHDAKIEPYTYLEAGSIVGAYSTIKTLTTLPYGTVVPRHTLKT